MTNRQLDFRGLSGLGLAELLKREDQTAWNFVCREIVRREKVNRKVSEMCGRLGLQVGDLMGILYEDMVGTNKRLDLFRGTNKVGEQLDADGLINWMRLYLRNHLRQAIRERENGRTVSIDRPVGVDDGEAEKTLSDWVSASLYNPEDTPVSRNDKWQIAHRCFAELWRENSMQAYVMLLKTRFLMSSQEIKERLGISSTANVDQLFSRAVKAMKELKVKHDN